MDTDIAKVKVLLVGSNPDDTENIRTDRFLKAINNGIAKANKTDYFQIELIPASSFEECIVKLEEFKPNILHLVGHGDRLDQFAFEEAQGGRELIETSPFADHISHYIPDLKCVIISACHSYDFAFKLTQTINYSIGFDGTLNTSIAQDFSNFFYFFLASGEDFLEAAEKTKTKLISDGISKELIPGIFYKQNLRYHEPILATKDLYDKYLQQLRAGSQKYLAEIITKDDPIYSTNDISSIKLISNEQEELPLKDYIKSLQNGKERHVLLIADPQKGKTFFMLKLWESYLVDDQAPIPIYISFKDYKNAQLPKEKEKFIYSTICKSYLHKRYIRIEDYEKLDEIFKEKKNNRPGYLIFLDEYHWVNDNKQNIQKEIKDMCQEMHNIQIIITSRADIRDTDGLINFKLLKITSYFKGTTNIQNGMQKQHTIEQKEIFLYVLTSVKNKIYKNITKELRRLIPSNMYHETYLEEWKPFDDDSNIKTILEDFRKKHGYAFTELYIDEELEEENRVLIKERLTNTIVIVDALSLPEKAKTIASDFDDAETVGTIIPVCEQLKKKVKEVMKKRQLITFRTKDYYRRFSHKNLKTTFFYPKVEVIYDLHGALKNIFIHGFGVGNHIQDRNEDLVNMRF